MATRTRGRLALSVVLVAALVGAVSAFVMTRDDSAAAPTQAAPTLAPVTTPTPEPEIPVSTPLARPIGEIAAHDSPGGSQISTVGRWYGYEMTMPILEEDGDWLRIRLPERPNELTGWVRAGEVERAESPWRLVVDLSDTEVIVYRAGFEQWRSPLGIGKDSTRTPTGEYFVAVVEKPGRPGYGSVVLNLNAHSEDIWSWQGAGDAIVAFHGPFGSEELLRAGGGKVSNGCLRMLPEDQEKLAPIPEGTPVTIRS